MFSMYLNNTRFQCEFCSNAGTLFEVHRSDCESSWKIIMDFKV